MSAPQPIVDRAPGVEPTLRPARQHDGAEMWRVVRDSGQLETNSAYAYLVMARDFGDSCVIAERAGRVVGFILGYRLPRAPEVVFVWQVGVDGGERGRGLAGRMLSALIDLPGCSGVRFVETTVAPSNQASLRLFSSFARRHRVPIEGAGAFASTDFRYGEHEQESRYRIGPFSPKEPT